MIYIKGLGKLTNDLELAKMAVSNMEGELGTVNFNPYDPESIDAAVQEVERLIDQRLGHYFENPIVGPMIDAMKGHYRTAIFDKAASARITNGEDNG